MAGTIPLSMTQQFDVYGQPLSGGQLYIIIAGTVSTPQDAFQDIALTIKQPYPMTLDAAGRVPAFFLADGTVKIRLQDKNGVVQLAADQVLVIGPSSGGGGGGSTVDPTQLIQTGNMILRYGVGTVDGYVRCNGLTIGSSTSGATMPEGARPECQALFQHLWNVDPNLVVTPGPRTTASGDWTSNKRIATPDLRGRVVAGMDDMGNTFANRIGNVVFSTTLGGSNAAGTGGNDQQRTLVTANLPAYTPAGSVANGAITTTISPSSNIMTSSGLVQVGGGGSFFSATLNSGSATSTQAGSTFTGTAQGGTSQQFGIVQPTMAVTMYLKL
jgi:hypothetical protein